MHNNGRFWHVLERGGVGEREMEKRGREKTKKKYLQVMTEGIIYMSVTFRVCDAIIIHWKKI